MLAGIARSIVKTTPKTMTRNINIIPGPALNPMSTAEKLGYGAFMFGVWLFIPAWVLVNIKHYKAAPQE